MKSSTKNQLIAFIIVLLLVVLAVWYIMYPRQQYNKLETLHTISFQPSQIGGQTPPLFTFVFSDNINPKIIAGSTASLKSFTPTALTPEISLIIESLLKNGGVPFTPTFIAPASIISNTMPTGLSRSFASVSFTGAGSMWFTKPHS